MLAAAPSAGAADDGVTPLAARAASDVVLVRDGEVVDEDLYAGGNRITIEGVIEGDLIVWAFDRLDVSGTVEGDIIGFAANASITGEVQGSVRLIGFDIDATGQVGDDLMAIGWNVLTSGDIGRDLLAWTRDLTVGGTVGRDVEGQSIGSTLLTGSIGRDVEMTVRNLRLTDTAVIGQDLGYESARDARIDGGAVVAGTTTKRSPFLPDLRVSAIRLVAVLLAFLAFLWMGLLAIWLMPRTMKEATYSVRDALWRSFIVGIVALLTPLLLVASILAIAALSPPELAFTVLGVGAPFWLGILMVLLLALFVAPVPIAIGIGRLVLGRGRSVFAAFVLGALIFVALLFVPIVGPIVLGLTLIVGLGALARGAIRARGGLRWTTAEANPPRRTLRRAPVYADDGLGPITSEDGIDAPPVRDDDEPTTVELTLVDDPDDADGDGDDPPTDAPVDVEEPASPQ